MLIVDINVKEYVGEKENMNIIVNVDECKGNNSENIVYK